MKINIILKFNTKESALLYNFNQNWCLSADADFDPEVQGFSAHNGKGS